MTDASTQPENQPENGTAPPDPRVTQAVEDEGRGLDEALRTAELQYLRQRVVGLNMEVRARDERLAALEAELASYRNDGPAKPIPDA